MNRIVLIGNGFDLAHGLKTSYRDFIEYLKSKNKIQNSNNNFLMKLCQINEEKNWCDIELEYYKEFKEYIINPDKYRTVHGNKNDMIRKLNKDFREIKDLLKTYLKGINDEIVHAPKNGNIPVPFQSVENIDKITKAIWNKIYSTEFKKLIQNFLFINFNYTDTLNAYMELPPDIAKLYTLVGPNKPKIQTIKIHGSLYDDNNPIIFGYGDRDDEIFDKIKFLENDLQENMKSHQYSGNLEYKKIQDFIKDEYEIFIIGHSCGTSDKTLLKTLFENPKCKSIKAFYYDVADKENKRTNIVNKIFTNGDEADNKLDVFASLYE